MLYRIYINSLDSDQIWSTDGGTTASEENWHGIQIRTRVDTNQDLTKRGSKTEPCCWIEASGTLRQVNLNDGKRWAVIE